MKRTDIEWTATYHPDGTATPGLSANPLKYRDNATGKAVWACEKISPGCAHCYAESLAKRYDRGGPFNARKLQTLTPFVDRDDLRHILTAKAVGGHPVAGSRCFLGDMTDVFGAWVSDDLLDQLFAAMALRGDVTFQVLTKRPERMAAYLNGPYRAGAIQDACRVIFDRMDFRVGYAMPWPLPNLWLGVSCENKAALPRLDALRTVPAAVRFVSFEPLLEVLGPVNLGGIGWSIVGGESGAGARPCRVDWVRGIVNQCQSVGVAVFVKQLGSDPRCSGCTGPGEHWPTGVKRDAVPGEFRVRLRDRKGGDIAEFPEDLRVRQFPAPAGRATA